MIEEGAEQLRRVIGVRVEKSRVRLGERRLLGRQLGGEGAVAVASLLAE